MVRPVLLVEGDGDREAVPELMRRLFAHLGLIGIPAPRPILCGDVRKLLRTGEVEKFVTYACRRSDGDSVLLTVDCEDECPVEVARELALRIAPLAERHRRRVGLVFLEREFETLFLYSLPSLTAAFPEFGWDLDKDATEHDWTTVRDAKGRLNKAMSRHWYKETRDQVRFAARVDLDRLAERSRAFLHCQRTLLWLSDPEAEAWVYPALA
ncbi:MAG: DUF4276 family protein [Acidobacteriota bacterium]